MTDTPAAEPVVVAYVDGIAHVARNHGVHAGDAKARRPVLLPDGRVGTVLRVPIPAGVRTSPAPVTTRGAKCNVQVGGRYARFYPADLTVLVPLTGEGRS